MAKRAKIQMAPSYGKSNVFQKSLEHAKVTGKLIKKETVGGITTETYQRHDDGRKWLFAYRAKNHVISSALSAVSSTSLA